MNDKDYDRSENKMHMSNFLPYVKYLTPFHICLPYFKK